MSSLDLQWRVCECLKALGFNASMSSLARGLETDSYHATRAISTAGSASAETAAALQARAQRRALSCYSVQVSSDDGEDATCFLHVDFCKRRVRFIKKQILLDEWSTDAILRVSDNVCTTEARMVALKHHHSLLRSKLTCADLLLSQDQASLAPILEEGSTQISTLVIQLQGLMLFTMQRLPIRILCANSLHRNHMAKLLRCVTKTIYISIFKLAIDGLDLDCKFNVNERLYLAATEYVVARASIFKLALAHAA